MSFTRGFMPILILLVMFLAGTRASAIPVYTKFGKGFEVQKNSEIVIANMPRVLSQDTLGLCYSYSAAALLTAENCRIKKADCSKIPDSEVFSPLDMARFGQDADGENTYSSSYRGIRDGGPAAHTLEIGAFFVGSAASQECASLDKLLTKLGGSKNYEKAQDVVFKKLKESYQGFKKIDPKCEKCLNDFFATARDTTLNNLEVKNDNLALLKAFSEDSYEKFFDRLVLPRECARAKNMAFYEGKNSTKMNIFPNEERTASVSESVQKTKEVLSRGHALLVEGVCMDEKPAKECKNSHALVINGYRRVCDKAKNCYDAVKLHNSYGQAWQDAFDGGWVDAESFFKSVKRGRNFLSWIEDKEK